MLGDVVQEEEWRLVNCQKRLLFIFIKLLSGEKINKFDLMAIFDKKESTIQRDISHIESVLEDTMYATGILEGAVLVRDGKGNYHLKGLDKIGHLGHLTDDDLFIILKIVLSTRIFNKQEMTVLIEKLLTMSKDRKGLEHCIGNEYVYYQGIAVDNMIPRLSFIANAIHHHGMLEFSYTKNGETEVFRRVPNAIYYSDMYFFMICSSHTAKDDRDFKTLNKFRINNMYDTKIVSTCNKVSRKDKFEGGILRGQTPFPFLGNPILLVIDFYYDPIYVLDRFPESRIVQENADGSFRIELRGNDGYGVKMWLLGQGHMVKVIAPNHIKEYLVKEITKTMSYYNLEVIERIQKNG